MKKEKKRGGGAAGGFKLPSPLSPPSDMSLHADFQSVESVSKPEYWRKICPQLTVQDPERQKSCVPLSLPLDDLQEAEARVKEDGYTDLTASQLPVSVSIDDLALGVVQLMQHGWQPSFISVFDEAWMLAHEVSTLMKEVTGNEINMDMLAWYIDASKGNVGFSPHRDRQPDDSPSTFRPDGKAKYTTIWIPFTDATHDNSCLYVIPRPFDPGYYDGDDDSDDAPDPLSVALSSKEAYQCIRAIPATAGSAVIFTHRTIHWGSRGRPGCTKPRISFSFGCASDDYEDAYFSRQWLPFPDHMLRLALACGQMIVYHERFNLSMSQLSLFNTIFKKEAHRFSSSYRSTVRFELIGTVKDCSKQTRASQASGGGDIGALQQNAADEDGDDEDVLDDMMDAMLDAKMKGLDAELDDDFDDVDDLRNAAADYDDFEMSDEDGIDDDDEDTPVPVVKHPSLHGGLRPGGQAAARKSAAKGGNGSAAGRNGRKQAVAGLSMASGGAVKKKGPSKLVPKSMQRMMKLSGTVAKQKHSKNKKHRR